MFNDKKISDIWKIIIYEYMEGTNIIEDDFDYDNYDKT